MLDILKNLKGFGSSLGKGIIREAIPGMASGLINNLFHQWNVDMVKITEKVQNNQPLWDGLDPGKRAAIRELAARADNLDFITPEWLIDSIRGDFPAVASLFLSWPKAKEWLANQIEYLKKQASEE